MPDPLTRVRHIKLLSIHSLRQVSPMPNPLTCKFLTSPLPKLPSCVCLIKPLTLGMVEHIYSWKYDFVILIFLQICFTITHLLFSTLYIHGQALSTQHASYYHFPNPFTMKKYPSTHHETAFPSSSMSTRTQQKPYYHIVQRRFLLLLWRTSNKKLK